MKIHSRASQTRPKLNSTSPTMRDALLSLIPNVRAFAVSLCGDVERADDLVQETLLKAGTHFESFQEGTNLRAWLFTILRNTYFSECRRRRHEAEDPEGRKAETLCVGPTQYGHVDLQDLHHALIFVPAEQREALILVVAAGFSYEEAAAITGCAVGTIKSRVNRARHKLVELMGVSTSNEFALDPPMCAIVTRSTGRSGLHSHVA